MIDLKSAFPFLTVIGNTYTFQPSETSTKVVEITEAGDQFIVRVSFSFPSDQLTECKYFDHNDISAVKYVNTILQRYNEALENFNRDFPLPACVMPGVYIHRRYDNYRRKVYYCYVTAQKYLNTYGQVSGVYGDSISYVKPTTAKNINTRLLKTLESFQAKVANAEEATKQRLEHQSEVTRMEPYKRALGEFASIKGENTLYVQVTVYTEEQAQKLLALLKTF